MGNRGRMPVVLSLSAIGRSHLGNPGYNRGSQPQYGSGTFENDQITFGAGFGHLRWTVDTAEDLERIRRLTAGLPENVTWLQALAGATREPDPLGLSESTTVGAPA